jgi:hypothetical protein
MMVVNFMLSFLAMAGAGDLSHVKGAGSLSDDRHVKHSAHTMPYALVSF